MQGTGHEETIVSQIAEQIGMQSLMRGVQSSLRWSSWPKISRLTWSEPSTQAFVSAQRTQSFVGWVPLHLYTPLLLLAHTFLIQPPRGRRKRIRPTEPEPGQPCHILLQNLLLSGYFNLLMTHQVLGVTETVSRIQGQ